MAIESSFLPLGEQSAQIMADAQESMYAHWPAGDETGKVTVDVELLEVHAKGIEKHAFCKTKSGDPVPAIEIRFDWRYEGQNNSGETIDRQTPGETFQLPVVDSFETLLDGTVEVGGRKPNHAGYARGAYSHFKRNLAVLLGRDFEEITDTTVAIQDLAAALDAAKSNDSGLFYRVEFETKVQGMRERVDRQTGQKVEYTPLPERKEVVKSEIDAF